KADRRVMRASRHRWLSVAAVLAVVLVCRSLAVPAPAHAAIGSPGSGIGVPDPLDLLSGLPGPADLIGEVFEFFFRTFFGIQATVTQRTVEWLLAVPVYTDQSAYADLNRLCGDIEVAAWALFTLV